MFGQLKPELEVNTLTANCLPCCQHSVLSPTAGHEAGAERGGAAVRVRHRRPAAGAVLQAGPQPGPQGVSQHTHNILFCTFLYLYLLFFKLLATFGIICIFEDSFE